MFVNQQIPLKIALTKEDQETIPGEVLDLEIQIKKYLNAKRSEGLSPGTIRFYRRCLTKFSKFCGTRAITSIAQIDRDEIRGYMNWLQDLGLNPGGRHGHYRSVRAFLNWWFAEQREPSCWRIPYDHKTLKAPKLPEKALDPVSMDDFERLIETYKGRSFTAVRVRAILHTLLSSGVRASELCRLKLSQVDLTTGIVRVKSGKGAKDRTTIINSAAWRRRNAPGGSRLWRRIDLPICLRCPSKPDPEIWVPNFSMVD